MSVGPMLRALRRRKSASALLVLEVALGMVVLVNTVVIGAHYWDMTFAPSGVDEDNLVFVSRRLGADGLDPDAARERAGADLRRLASLPDVIGASAIDELPFSDSMQLPTVAGVSGDGGRSAVAWPVRASAGVVVALGLQLLKGRDFAPGERDVALVTNTLAERMVTGGDVVGRMVHTEGLPALSVVGVVRDFRVRPSMAPDYQSVLVVADLPVSRRELSYVVHSRPGQSPAVAARIPDILAPGQVATRYPDLTTRRTHRISRGALIIMMWMMVIVVGVALAGALAVTSFSVSERTRQIGVRRALGATRGDIILYFLGENAWLTSAGIAIGLLVTLPLNAMMRKLNLMPLATWWQVGLSMALFWGASLASALGPALRAARIPPTAAIRTI